MAGTKEFTLGAYNPDFNDPLNNRLEKAIGCDGCDSVSTDFGVAGRASIVLSAPNNMSDTDFINSLGEAFNSATDGQNYVFYGPGSDGYSNSNNFVYDIGLKVGIENQISEFKPNWYTYTPGNSKGLGEPNKPSKSQQIVNSTKTILTKLKNIIKRNKN